MFQLEDYLTHDEIQQDQQRIKSQFEEARRDLNSLSAPGGCESPEQVHSVRENFTARQFEGWVRELQIKEYLETGTFTGTLHRAMNKVFVRHGISPIEWPDDPPALPIWRVDPATEALVGHTLKEIEDEAHRRQIAARPRIKHTIVRD